MQDRRDFLKELTVAAAGLSIGLPAVASGQAEESPRPSSKPIECSYILWVPKKGLTAKQVVGVVRSRVLEVIKYPEARDPMSMKSWPSGFKPARMALVDFYDVPQYMMHTLPFQSKILGESVYAFKFMVTGE